jgi:hypothetical protein
MAECLAFLRVADITNTVEWYEHIGFRCLGTHQEPGCELDWALLGLDGASFMLYPGSEKYLSHERDAGLYFKLREIDSVTAKLKTLSADIIEIVEETEYGRREIVIRDINGFQVTFSCEPTKRN